MHPKQLLRLSTKLILISLCTIIIVGCNQTPTTPPITKEDVTLKIFYSEWPPDMMSYVAQEKGFFKKNNVKVNLIYSEGTSFNLEKRKKGELDIWSYPLLNFVTEYSDGIEQNAQIILLQDISNGADGVITMNKKIKTIQDLKGKKVGLEKYTISEFFLKILLEREKLTLDDIILIDVTFDDVLEKLQNGEIDAGVSYEPVLTKTIAAGGMVIRDSSQERGVIVDVTVANKDHIAKHPEAYKAYVKSILEAHEFYNNHPEEAADIIKEKLGMTREEVIETFTKLQLANIRDNKIAFDRSSGFSSLYTLARQAQEYISTQNKKYKSFDFEPLIYSDIIESLSQ